MADTVLASYIIASFNAAILWERHHYASHFTESETEAHNKFGQRHGVLKDSNLGCLCLLNTISQGLSIKFSSCSNSIWLVVTACGSEAKGLGAVLGIYWKEFCDQLVMSDMDSGRESVWTGSIASEGNILGLVLINSHWNMDWFPAESDSGLRSSIHDRSGRSGTRNTGFSLKNV